MTFAELLTAMEACEALPRSRMKDCKTSLRYLSAALGASSLDEALVTDACRDETHWGPMLDAHFRALTAQGHTVSAATIRNTRNNLRVLWRQAEAQGLCVAASPQPPALRPPLGRVAFERQHRGVSPYQSTYRPSDRGYWLPPAQWPPDIQAGWQTYRERCGLRLRASTLESNAKRLATYLGFLWHIQGCTLPWEALFAVPPVQAFVQWHAARFGRTITWHAASVVWTLAAIAKVLEHPEARALADFRNALPAPTPLRIKRQHWLDLATLERIADLCLTEGRAPVIAHATSRNPGVSRTFRFQRGLMLKLLVRIPLRQRNVRELRLRHNLYQDQAGHWHVHFRGDELKVGSRGALANEYHIDLTTYCPDLLPLLEEFVQTFRPRLPNALTSPYLFLTRHGTPFTQHGVGGELSGVVERHTGQRFYPHLIRTIWATEYLDKTGDVTGAAVMLGDKVQTVLAEYHEILNKDQHAKAKAFLDTALTRG